MERRCRTRLAAPLLCVCAGVLPAQSWLQVDGAVAGLRADGAEPMSAGRSVVVTVPAGDLALHFAPLADGKPASLRTTLPDGAATFVAVPRLAGEPPPARFQSSFDDASPSGFASEPTGSTTYRVENGALTARAPEQSAPWHPLLVAVDTPVSCRVGARLRLDSSTAVVALVARWLAPDQHYRLVVDRRRAEVRLERAMGPSVIVLGKAARRFGAELALALQVDGFRIAAFLDDEAVLHVMDGGHSRGGVGVLVGAGTDASFDDFAVTLPLPPLPVVAAVCAADRARVVGSAASWPGAVFAIEGCLDRPYPCVPGGEATELFVLQRPLRASIGWPAVSAELGPGGEFDLVLPWSVPRGLRGQAMLLRPFVIDAEGGAALARLPSVVWRF